MLPDGRNLAKRAREEASSWRDNYKTPISGAVLADRLGNYKQLYTSYSSVRPFGITSIVAAVDEDGPCLYMIEPSGSYWGYHGAATGKGRQIARNEMEKLDLANMTVRQAVNEAARM